MTINYQIMTEDQKIDGKYRPDYKKLMENAKTGEELAYIQKVAENKSTFAYNMVYVTKQKCGHYEIFQTPMNEYQPPLEMTLETIRDYTNRECTRCICEW